MTSHTNIYPIGKLPQADLIALLQRPDPDDPRVILGPGLGGWLAGDSLSTPFFIAAGMSLLSLLLIFFLLPERCPLKRVSEVK